MGAAAVAAQPDRRIARRRQLHAARRRASRSPLCSAAWCARSTATARSMPASTGSAAPSRRRTSGTPSATASPPPSSIRLPARRSRSSNGSTRCSISLPRTSTRSAARRRSGACTEIIAEGTSADRQIDIFSKAKAAGRRRLTAIKDVIDWAAAETQAVRPRPALSAERRPGFPLAARATYKAPKFHAHRCRARSRPPE